MLRICGLTILPRFDKYLFPFFFFFENSIIVLCVYWDNWEKGKYWPLLVGSVRCLSIEGGGVCCKCYWTVSNLKWNHRDAPLSSLIQLRNWGTPLPSKNRNVPGGGRTPFKRRRILRSPHPPCGTAAGFDWLRLRSASPDWSGTRRFYLWTTPRTVISTTEITGCIPKCYQTNERQETLPGKYKLDY